MRTVRFAVPAEVAFDYLVDPANRPAWQSSLRAVDDVTGETGVPGQHWHDVTVVGIRPHMRLTASDRPHSWTEAGTWHGFEAELTLDFEPSPDGGCDVVVRMDLHGRGVAAVPAALLSRLAPAAVRSDLARAARILGSGR